MSAPFVKDDSVAAGGWPVLSSTPTGLTLRFIPSTPFGVGIVFHNRAKDPLTIIDVQAAAPPRSLVRQIGVRLLPWNPPPCNGRHSCLFAGFLRSPYSPSTPTPLPLAAGAAAAVQLNFELGRCADVPLASPATPREVDVSYRWGSGPLEYQRVALGSAQLHLRMPRPRDCLPGPHSRIALTGPFGISSDWTVPGSGGDTCTRWSDGGLRFVSRLYQATDAPTVRVCCA